MMALLLVVAFCSAAAVGWSRPAGAEPSAGRDGADRIAGGSDSAGILTGVLHEPEGCFFRRRRRTVVAEVPAAGRRQGTLAGRVWHMGSVLQAVNPRAQPRRRAGAQPQRSVDRSRRAQRNMPALATRSLSLFLSLSHTFFF